MNPEQMLLKLKLQSMTATLADFAEEAQNTATKLDERADVAQGGQRAILLNDRDKAIATARAFLEAAKLVHAESMKIV